MEIESSERYDSLFFRCDALTSAAERNPIFRSEGNCIIKKPDNTLIGGCSVSVIPDSVEAIGDYAFKGVGNLGILKIRYGVKSIGNYAFDEYLGLRTVRIPDNATIIVAYAFESCLDFTSVVIPESVTKIGIDAFSYGDVYVPFAERPEGWIFRIGNCFKSRWNSGNAVWACDIAYEGHYPYVVLITCLTPYHDFGKYYMGAMIIKTIPAYTKLYAV